MPTAIARRPRPRRVTLAYLRRLAERCRSGDEAACREYNELVKQVRRPFMVYRGVHVNVAMKDLERGEIQGAGYYSEPAYFSLDPRVAYQYMPLGEGVIYALTVDKETEGLLVPVGYSARGKQGRLGPEDYARPVEHREYATEMSFIAPRAETPVKVVQDSLSPFRAMR